MGLGSSLKNIFLGKKSESTPGGYVPLDPMQKQLMGEYGNQLSRFQNEKALNPDEIASAEVAKQEQMIRSGAQDAQRQAQQLVAQRGLGRSSVGLNAILGVNRDLNDRIFANRAQEGGLANQLRSQMNNDRINQLGALSGGVGNILNSRIYNPAVQGGVRGGGLLAPILGLGGAILGGKKGGAEGAMAGYNVGSGIGKSFSNYGG